MDASASFHSKLFPFTLSSHALHAKRCLTGLPSSQVELESSTLALAFYCLASLDLLGILSSPSTHKHPLTEEFKTDYKDWIWEQYVSLSLDPNGATVEGFRPGTWMTPQKNQHDHSTSPAGLPSHASLDEPNLIMTYTALLSLAILRGDTHLSRVSKEGLKNLLNRCQNSDGSFSTTPTMGDGDLRTTYCAFVISFLIEDWSSIDLVQALSFIQACRTYEGGYGQFPGCEAQGGTTYTAIASLQVYSQSHPSPPNDFILTPSEKAQTLRFVTSLQSPHSQDQPGKIAGEEGEGEENRGPGAGFAGRTNKVEDACYCFWCGATLRILASPTLSPPISIESLRSFLSACQFKYGGIAKAREDTPDPYHTYLSLAALCCFPEKQDSTVTLSPEEESWTSWIPPDFDPVINARQEVVSFAKLWIGKRDQNT